MLSHLVIQIPDDVTSEDCKVYINGRLGTEPNSSNVTGDPTYSANDDKLRDGTATSTIQWNMAQICV